MRLHKALAIASPSRPVVPAAGVCIVTRPGTSTLRDPILQLIQIERALSSEPHNGDQSLSDEIVHSCCGNPESLCDCWSFDKAFSGWHRFTGLES